MMRDFRQGEQTLPERPLAADTGEEQHQNDKRQNDNTRTAENQNDNTRTAENQNDNSLNADAADATDNADLLRAGDDSQPR